jgi:hypothetical protein
MKKMVSICIIQLGCITHVIDMSLHWKEVSLVVEAAEKRRKKWMQVR